MFSTKSHEKVLKYQNDTHQHHCYMTQTKKLIAMALKLIMTQLYVLNFNLLYMPNTQILIKLKRESDTIQPNLVGQKGDILIYL